MSARRAFPITLLSIAIATALSCFVLWAFRFYAPSNVGNVETGSLFKCIGMFPLLVVWSNAVVVLFRRRKKHHNVSTYAVAGILGFVSLVVCDFAFFIWWQSFRKPGQLWVMHVGQLLLTVGQAICWWALFVALLGWRGEDSEE